MTKEEAIQEVKLYDIYPNGLSKECREYIIKALEQQPSEDCVSRAEAIEWIENLREMDKSFGNYKDDYFPLSEVIDRLKNVPSVTPVAALATVKFSKEDLREICNERIEIECTHGTCKDCKWWDSENNKIGYCNACKHGYCSSSWNIGIYRRTKTDFYCADFEKRGAAG